MKFYITTPIYYVNDEPHIGHAYTTIVGDVLARYHRQIGDQVFYLTGTDEHGAKIAESAAKKNMAPQDFCDQNAAKFQEVWQILNISHDQFIRTTDQRHEDAVVTIFQTLYDRGFLEEREYEGMYCVGCEKFLNTRDLINGQCPDHKRTPEIIKEKNWFFKLEQFLPKIEELVRQDKIEILPPSRQNEVLGLIREGVMKDFSVSRQKSQVSWGIELPFDRDQVSYVWIDALSNYITAIGYPVRQDKFEEWWPADLHLMAQDILKFHTIYWPAILMALDLPLPKTMFIHGFFTINGEKMSKSLGNVIKPQSLVDQFGADAARYLLLSQFPFGQESDIREDVFVERYNADLANGYGNAVARVTNLIEKNKLQIKLNKDMVWLNSLAEEYNSYRFDLVLNKIQSKLQELDGYITKTVPWKVTNTSELITILSNAANELWMVSQALLPFMPNIALQVIDTLEADQIVKAPPLFPRL
ncbi:MAG: methionine--tRNA ligase [Parcubacteria group bacterium CG1_02_37_51]|uniref:Methionine--tRNA ligase n=2 Tax=Candidatus Komeiliibacteriota TaxID=1817908 RepID=A0A2M8DQ13_9BACT|nr:MAG: methionine--tRNA ligase [Parcubacteria group bacterium CG1_02_37_51]PIY95170.1 MAG: methionine--tRNA ligase [Candidatus Komeilibacteria bacterium CG_4_10_14_0_8_um_filter_37_78]PJC01022.1 MAG: methionine--tRNA ligase [Candidatus Komeilibacteria bacterium CG_4_9_14_0_8_um_filter_36_9]